MSVEGRVHVSARLAEGRLEGVRIAADRPLLARRLLVGRTPAEALELLPSIYSLCGRSQATVAAAALDAALGRVPGQAIQRRRVREMTAETTGEHAFRLLLDWPALSGDPGDVALLSRMRSLLAGAAASEGSWGAARDALVMMTEARILGTGMDSWLEQFSADEWIEWARSRRTGCAGTMATLASLTAWSAPDIPQLVRPQHSLFVEQIAMRALEDPGFAAAPVLDGQPAECGPLARCLSHPAVRDLTRRDRITARAFARLAEFTLMLREDSVAGHLESAMPSPGVGAAMGEMARGMLVHAARLEGGRIADYAIVAPTEWNFHPRGALFRELSGRPVRDEGEAKRALAFAAATLDPCVALEAGLDGGEPGDA
jgi:coenzyme F420-reducing hydrogenase alpha subunit